jgi:adenylate cyclase
VNDVRRRSEDPSISDWLLGEGRQLATPGEMLSGLCERLVQQGVPIDRVGLHVRTLHPEVLATRTLWQRGSQASLETLYARSDPQEAFLRSPFFVVYDTGETLRRRLDGSAEDFDFPILAELKAEGFTDYVVAPIRFGTGQLHAATWASRRPGGFRDADLSTIAQLLPVLAVVTEVHEARRMTRTLLSTYLGPQTGIRVLNGTIRRGDGQTIAAALWYCDLRGFTAMSDALPRDEVIALLNAYFERMAHPVQARGGELLKFIGDAILAIFPIADDLDRDRACRTALDAAEAALAELAELNTARSAEGAPALKVGIGLHMGAVMYGNIGAPGRLDFTVIGPAVNLVTRLESLCVVLGQPLLTSARFASPCGSKLVSLGRHPLKGITDPQEIFGLPH